MSEYVKGFFVLFVVLLLLLYLPPGKSYQKYIRFFAELILTLGIIAPVLNYVWDSEEFLRLIEYEEFTESISEVSRDMQRIEYIHNDAYIREYETAIGEDVRQIAEQIAGQYGLSVQSASIHMTEEYGIDQIRIAVTNETAEQIVVDRIMLSEEENGVDRDVIYEGIAQKVSEYYGIEPSMIEITYAKAGQEG